MGSSKYPLVTTVVCSRGAASCGLCGPLCCGRAEYCGHMLEGGAGPQPAWRLLAHWRAGRVLAQMAAFPKGAWG